MLLPRMTEDLVHHLDNDPDPETEETDQKIDLREEMRTNPDLLDDIHQNLEEDHDPDLMKKEGVQEGRAEVEVEVLEDLIMMK